jgi:hypothetical protein
MPELLVLAFLQVKLKNAETISSSVFTNEIEKKC